MNTNHTQSGASPSYPDDVPAGFPGGLPDRIFTEYESGINYKASLGDKGLYEQNKLNERFYAGDQWRGARCGNDRPLVRYNVIRRIGDYKIAMVSSSPLAVNYAADGVPNTIDIKKRVEFLREAVSAGIPLSEQTGETYGSPPTIPCDEEVTLIMSALSDYFKTTAERLKFDDLKTAALKNAYLSGTGILYTYWDPAISTGLYADEARRTPIKGDIASEVLDIENVYFGDPSLDSIEDQPYIILAQRRSVGELKREAKRNKRPPADLEKIKTDEASYMAGDRSDTEIEDAKKCTVLTKLWKEWNDEGTEYTVMAARVVKGAVIRKTWDIGIRMYPLSKFSWDRRKNCAYGDTELTYLIPNQIAVNRMITASVWAVMVMGMPLMIVNNNVVPGPVTNDPGQIIRVNGSAEDVEGAVRYVTPPSFAPGYDNSVNSLIRNTMTQAGANDAALGDLRPDNTSAIIALREAAALPLQGYQNAFHSFVEDVARIWAEFWITQYGKRSIKINDEKGTWYFPFSGDRYKDLIVSARIDVGASGLWSENQSIETLDNLFNRQIINVEQYLQRMPKGIIPDALGLIKEIQAAGQQTKAAEAAEAACAGTGGATGSGITESAVPPELMAQVSEGGSGAQAVQMDQGALSAGGDMLAEVIDQLPPELQDKFASLSDGEQMAMLQQIGMLP